MSKSKTFKRVLNFSPESFDESGMTIECVYATETSVDRGAFLEELVISPEAIDSVRLESGSVPLIWNHEWEAPRIVGRVVSHRIDNGQAIAVIKLSKSSYSQGTVQDIRDGIIKSVSVGYDVLDYETIDANSASSKPIRKVTRWMPFEVSIVGIPADHLAQFRSKRMENEDIMQGDTTEEKVDFAEKIEEAKQSISDAITSLMSVIDEIESDSTTDEARDQAWKINSIATRLLTSASTVEEIEEAATYAVEQLQKIADSLASSDEGDDEIVVTEEVSAERSRVASIESMCRTFRVSPADTQKMIRNGVSVKGARDMIKKNKVSRSAGNLSTARTRIIRDESQTRREAIRDALYSRMSGKRVSEKGAEYRSMSFKEMARSLLGTRSRGMSDSGLYGALMGRSFGPHTSADLGFTGAFNDALNLRIAERYEQTTFDWEPVIRRTTVRNFLPQRVISAGSFPALKMIPEGAEIEFGTFDGDSGVLSIKKYGRAIAFTEEAFINDDLNFLDILLTETAASVRALEESLVYDALTSDALRSDGLPVFNTTRGNVIAEALDIQGLAVASAALRAQKDVSGTPLNLRPRTLIVGSANEVAAWRLATPLAATAAEDVNPFARIIENVIVDPRIEGDDWYVASGATGDAIEYATLDGHEGLRTEEKWCPEISATAFYAKAYAGAAMTGWRGFVKSFGANEVDDN